MKLFAVLLLVPSLWAASLGQVHKVYVMPMGGGFDQLLAQRISGEHVLDVVADPKLADAVVTDRLGAGFEQKLARLVDDKKAATQAPAESSFNRPRGTVFLVDVKTRQVVWSTLAPPRDQSAHQLRKTAKRVVEELQDALTPPKP